MKTKLIKPEKLSDYRWKKYLSIFEQGCEMWTSEDGTLLSVAIAPVENWVEILERNFPHLWKAEKIDPARIRTEYAYQTWQGREYFDGPNSQRRGKIWMTSKGHSPLEDAPLPVLIYDLQFPR